MTKAPISARSRTSNGWAMSAGLQPDALAARDERDGAGTLNAERVDRETEQDRRGLDAERGEFERDLGQWR